MSLTNVEMSFFMQIFIFPSVNFDKTWSDVWMEGPAEIVFTGHFTLDEISK